jgi:hypothetical protein
MVLFTNNSKHCFKPIQYYIIMKNLFLRTFYINYRHNTYYNKSFIYLETINSFDYGWFYMTLVLVIIADDFSWYYKIIKIEM